MNQTEIVGPIYQMTAHNLQDVASVRKIDIFIPDLRRICAISDEHHGRIS